MATLRPRPSWSVFERRIVTRRPSGASSRSSTSSATSSERRKAPAKPSRMMARSRARSDFQGDVLYTNRRDHLIALAARYAMAIYMWSEFTAGGGLISYGNSLATGDHESLANRAVCPVMPSGQLY
jgi:hypothetical protein